MLPVVIALLIFVGFPCAVVLGACLKAGSDADDTFSMDSRYDDAGELIRVQS